MRSILLIAWRDFRAFFTQPMAYLMISGYLMLTSMIFNSSLGNYLINQRNPSAARSINLNLHIIDPLFSTMAILMLVLVPLITMRLIAEEFRLRTDELWMTSPVSINQILLGKYIATVAFFLVLILASLSYPLILLNYGEPAVIRIFVDALALFLVVASLAAAGLFASSLTDNVVVAFFTGFGINVACWIMVGFGNVSWLGQLISYLSISSHYSSMTRGLLDSRDLVYFGSFIFLFLFMANRSLESKGWR